MSGPVRPPAAVGGGRIALGVVGAAAIGFGALSALTQLWTKLPLVVLWLVVPLALHDGVLAPATRGILRVGRRLLPSRLWGAGVLFLVLAGTAVLLTLPALLSPAGGKVPGLLDRDYGVGLGIAVVVAALVAASSLPRSRPPRRARRDG